MMKRKLYVLFKFEKPSLKVSGTYIYGVKKKRKTVTCIGSIAKNVRAHNFWTIEVTTMKGELDV
jgi:hypothetical protein